MGRKVTRRKQAQHRVTDEQLAAGLEKTLEGKYGKILDAAKRKWEREFGGKKEKSDAGVRVRVSGPPKPRRPRGGRKQDT